MYAYVILMHRILDWGVHANVHFTLESENENLP